MESYVIARPTGRTENGMHAKNIDKKGISEFLIIFFCYRCGCLMHVSVFENCRIQSTSIWYKNHQDILNVTKVVTVYIQELRLKNSSFCFVCVEVLRPSQQLRSCRAGQLPTNTVPGQVKILVNSTHGTRACGFPTPSWLHNDLFQP